MSIASKAELTEHCTQQSLSYSVIIQEQSQTIQLKVHKTKGWVAVVVYKH
jgi:hypothetical protein